jgi:hypothetical protein
MTNTASNDAVDPTADEQTRRPDDLEDWLSDLRVTLNDDPPDWLTPDDDVADPAPGSAATPSSIEESAVPDAGTPAHSARPDGNLEGDPRGPGIGRHRAPE